MPDPLGRIVILNGAPRAGKSSIAAAIQDRAEGVWVNVGVDRFKPMVAERYQPSLGLRPGGDGPDLEPRIARLYIAMYESIAAHSRLGLNVVTDVQHHDDYSAPVRILPECAKRLLGLPALFVGVRCPLDVILDRREATWGIARDPDGSIPAAIRRWQEAVHDPGIYDLELDTSQLAPTACADAILARLEDISDPSACQRLAAMAG